MRPAESHRDDCISSLRPFPGWEAVLFEHDGFEGGSLTVTGEMRDSRLVSGPCDGSWDDCASRSRYGAGPDRFTADTVGYTPSRFRAS
jgi:hypothetical protein